MWNLGLGDVDSIVELALREDLHAGDVTSTCTISAGEPAHAELVAKAPLVLCGIAVARRVFALVDPSVQFEAFAADGDRLTAGARVAAVTGSARSILAAERTALNFLQRLGGVATLTAAYVDAAAGRCRIVDTRKTTPGLRTLQRYAVRCGGGHNHRNDLGAAVLIKENHIRCARGITAAIAAARAGAPHTTTVECEVTTLAEVSEALEAGADTIMLDNMDDEQVQRAVGVIGGRAWVEVSGSVALPRVARLAALGVDLISVGALTHSAPAVDLSLLVTVQPR